MADKKKSKPTPPRPVMGGRSGGRGVGAVGRGKPTSAKAARAIGSKRGLEMESLHNASIKAKTPGAKALQKQIIAGYRLGQVRSAAAGESRLDSPKKRTKVVNSNRPIGTYKYEKMKKRSTGRGN